MPRIADLTDYSGLTTAHQSYKMTESLLTKIWWAEWLYFWKCLGESHWGNLACEIHAMLRSRFPERLGGCSTTEEIYAWFPGLSHLKILEALFELWEDGRVVSLRTLNGRYWRWRKD